MNNQRRRFHESSSQSIETLFVPSSIFRGPNFFFWMWFHVLDQHKRYLSVRTLSYSWCYYCCCNKQNFSVILDLKSFTIFRIASLIPNCRSRFSQIHKMLNNLSNGRFYEWPSFGSRRPLTWPQSTLIILLSFRLILHWEIFCCWHEDRTDLQSSSKRLFSSLLSHRIYVEKHLNIDISIAISLNSITALNVPAGMTVKVDSYEAIESTHHCRFGRSSFFSLFFTTLNECLFNPTFFIAMTSKTRPPWWTIPVYKLSNKSMMNFSLYTLLSDNSIVWRGVDCFEEAV